MSLRLELIPFLARNAWSLFLYGAVGARKTSVAAATLAYIRASGKWGSEAGGYGEWVSPDKLRTAMLDMERGKYAIEAWRMARVLVLDDLGAVRSTPHAQETVVQLILSRYDVIKPTIITSNLGLPTLAEHLDGRIASRLQEGVVLDVGDVDWRKDRR